MAHFHVHVKPGPKGKGADHAQYIAREGRFKAEKYGEIGEHEVGNLPQWARGSAARFFAAADDLERSNGNAYREFELALPKELSDAERVRLVRELVAEQLGTRHAYSWAIHEPNGHNPHVHIMYSERIIDGIERGPEQYFKRANTKQPERGGHLKSDLFTGRGGPAAVEALRVRWEQMQNQALERAGVAARVDHRSLKAQGIEREAGQHRGPAVSGVEARGKKAQVSVRRAAERVEQRQAREAVVAEMRVVTREEMALERVAVRERRELAAEVTGAERELVLLLVEADRREQLGRVEAQAERRVERRQGLGIDELRDKLLTQARALRARIGQQWGRVKEWVAQRFPDPIGRLQSRSRDLFETVVDKAREAMGREAGPEPAVNPPARRRGMFDGLQLGAGRAAERSSAFSEVRLSVSESTLRQAPTAEVLHQSIDRFARAWMDAGRMQDKELPVLPHQMTELQRAAEGLDRVRPGGSRDLLNSLEYEAGSRQAMHTLEGPPRVAQLLAGLEHEERIRRDPNLGAERLVQEWHALEARREKLKGAEHKAAREQLQARARELTRSLKDDPQLESIVKQRSRELGIAPGSRLAQILHERDLKRALSLSDLHIGRHRGLSL